ncbi:hypothetical protein [Pseudonocardia sp. NPDC049154]|uniref:hypothetical protein n=1 Tax=Pseudonocardia sp. NPDC049154 TaxID=3155501 RepID=UPI0033EFFBCB
MPWVAGDWLLDAPSGHPPVPLVIAAHRARIRHLSPRSPAGVDLSGRSSDLYLLHGHGRVTLDGTVAGFADLQAAGLIRY